MNPKTTFTPAQIQKLGKAFQTTRTTDWKLQTNSVATVQAFRTLLNAFPGLLRDWNGFYAAFQRTNTGWTTRSTTSGARRSTTRRGTRATRTNTSTGRRTSARKGANTRTTTTGTPTSRRNGAKRWNTNAKRWNGTSTRFPTNGRATSRFTSWSKRTTKGTKSRRAA